MKARDRILLAVGAPVVLVAFLWVAWIILPGVRQCGYIFISAASTCDPRGLDVFGQELFTPAQTAVMAAGILAAAFMIGLAVVPRRSPVTAAAFSALVLAALIALTLPSPTTAPAPTIPCSTPGSNGLVYGECVSGPTPVDARAGDRLLILAGGFVALGLGVGTDRRREPGSQSVRPPGRASGHDF